MIGGSRGLPGESRPDNERWIRCPGCGAPAERQPDGTYECISNRFHVAERQKNGSYKLRN